MEVELKRTDTGTDISMGMENLIIEKSKKIEEDELNNNAECEKKGNYFPYDIVDLDPEINAELLNDFTGKHYFVHFKKVLTKNCLVVLNCFSILKYLEQNCLYSRNEHVLKINLRNK